MRRFIDDRLVHCPLGQYCEKRGSDSVFNTREGHERVFKFKNTLRNRLTKEKIEIMHVENGIAFLKKSDKIQDKLFFIKKHS